ncbi:MAG: nucleotidyltransferase domain-containing protein [Chloroflexi bacterium CG07_land_8_20_14_0_80_51_10]|nr:MAG: nucleotidyltransferase domain-containing protein [Chloroflexi bacterium CG07_land_8_20_14_0_80_51_10]
MDKEIHFIIAEYRQKLEDLGVKVQKIILYGSYACRRATEESDIDLVVVSDNFKDMDLWERLCLLGRARIGIRKPVEILGLTEEEFAAEQGGTFIGDEVKSKGVEVI